MPHGKRRAPFLGLAWTILQRNSDCKQTTRPVCRNRQTFQLGGPAKLTSAHDPRHALQKNGGLADQWCMDDGGIVCHPILVLPSLQDFDVDNSRVGAEWNPLKTEVTHYVNDLDAAPLEWRTGDVWSWAKTSVVTAGGITLGVAVGSRQFITDWLLSKADVIRAMRERVQLSFEKVRASAVSTTSCGFTAIKSWRKTAQRSTMRSGSGLSNGSSRVSRRTARHKQPPVQASPELGSKERETSQPNRASRYDPKRSLDGPSS